MIIKLVKLSNKDFMSISTIIYFKFTYQCLFLFMASLAASSSLICCWVIAKKKNFFLPPLLICFGVTANLSSWGIISFLLFYGASYWYNLDLAFLSSFKAILLTFSSSFCFFLPFWDLDPFFYYPGRVATG